jgi:CRISPR/Cas system CSM-associated protein Csm3 (group 7 of RAMP superfamily)
MKDYIKYKVELKTLEPFRIGASKDVMSAFDNPIATIGGRVVVQGPTLKGFLRNQIEEYLIDQYSGISIMKPCIPSSERTLSADEKTLIASGKYRAKGACSYSSEDMKNKSDSICPACYFLGAMGLNGFARIPYLYTEKKPEELYSVRLDRAKGTVVEKTNRDYQIMADNVCFTGILEVMKYNTVNDWMLGKVRSIQDKKKLDGWLNETSKKFNKKFIDLSPEELAEEFLVERICGEHVIGGFKSKGCGKVSITCSKLKASD